MQSFKQTKKRNTHINTVLSLSLGHKYTRAINNSTKNIVPKKQRDFLGENPSQSNCWCSRRHLWAPWHNASSGWSFL